MSDSLNKAELNHFLAQQALKSQKKHLNHKFTRWFKALLIPLIFLAAFEFLSEKAISMLIYSPHHLVYGNLF
ncbi:binding--dependent transport systems inner membrane component domain protein [Acinetobacter baumannii 2887]|nr:binding--dependent transport systems inner membrane component domain protein [Acinetobacter baumannii 2887]